MKSTCTWIQSLLNKLFYQLHLISVNKWEYNTLEGLKFYLLSV
jgi:hypothetical protein